MKKIDKLITKSFIGPAILSYFVATFVLVMQFLWKYIDEILGKGLTILELVELIFYYAVTLIPMAVPITVLISSVMVFGDMAEKYELSSMKSAGVSLIRIMFPGIVVASLIGGFSVFSANYLKPASLLQFNKRFLAIRKQKTALAIEEGIFNDAFGETIIRVNKIDKDKKTIHDVLIYDHSENDKSLIAVMSSKSGEMYTTEDGHFFVMKLDTGVQYKEGEKNSKLGTDKTEIPFMRTYFDEWTKTFDMSQFDSSEGLLNFNRNREDMMNTLQLIKSLDSFRQDVKSNNEKMSSKLNLLFVNKTVQTPTKDIINHVGFNTNKTLSDSNNTNQEILSNNSELPSDQIKDSLKFEKMSMANDSLRHEKNKFVSPYPTKKTNTVNLSENTSKENSESKDPVVSNINNFSKRLIKLKEFSKDTIILHITDMMEGSDARDIVLRAQSDLSRDRDELLTVNNMNIDNIRHYEKYMLRLNQQYSWATVCILFLFIGAPLGSIIRKGGYGYPLLVAILFYMIFIISTIYGEKLIRNDLISGFNAAWLPCLILLPFAGLLTYMALRDIKLNFSGISDIVLRIFK
ncbi:MAG: LptF/LptG family permease [Saprospiraceae bacterium]|nr:LptF/LptG family permease [Saprospiraceae bacterium]MBL0027475.1 LptF/LptG family permease [Saprospiraceae bacterium]